jgi:hypothetical protein
MSPGATYLSQKLPDIHKETHEVSRVIGNNIGIIAADIFSCHMHSRFDCFARSVHEELCEPFEDHLDLLGVGFGEI